MNQNFDLLKKELSLEIKEIAKEISNIESYSGLLTHEIKFRSLYEKFIVLKFLDKKRIYIDDLNLPTEKPLSESVEKDIIQEEQEVVVNLNKEEELVEPAPIKPNNAEPEPLEPEDKPEEVINEKEEAFPDVEAPSPETKKQINPIRLDLNDKIAFRTLLFNGDTAAMDLVLKTLNRINDKPSSLQYLDELKIEMEWGDEVDEYLERLKELVLKRFNY